MSHSGRPTMGPDQIRMQMEKEQEKSYANRLWIIQYLYNKELEGDQDTADVHLGKFLQLEKDKVQSELRILRKTGWVTFTVAGNMYLDIELTGGAIETVEKKIPSFEPPLNAETNDPEYTQLRLEILKEENKGKRFDLILGIMRLPNMAERIWHHITGQG